MAQLGGDQTSNRRDQVFNFAIFGNFQYCFSVSLYFIEIRAIVRLHTIWKRAASTQVCVQASSASKKSQIHTRRERVFIGAVIVHFSDVRLTGQIATTFSVSFVFDNARLYARE